MSTYKEIIGKKIKKVSSDPSDGVDGQMWYNSTTGTLRGPALVSAWSSSAPLSTDRYAMGCGGTQTASVAAGGGIAAPPYVTAAVEEYNGSGWSTAPSLNTARGGLGSSKDGSQTAMLVFGGTSNSTATESFNGSAWTTTPNSLTTGKSQTSGAGTQGSALNAGRWGPPMIGNTEEWDGSSWSEQEDLNTARGDMACFGTQTAAIFAGGNSSSPPNYRNLAEQYNGTSWTVLPTLNTARGAGGSGAGSTTSGLVFGGNTPGPAASNASESWDGTSWTNTPSLAEAGARVGNGATGSAALAVGDYPITGVTEEYNSSTNTVTAAAWASTPSLGTARRQVGGFGHTTTTAVCACGQNPPALSNVEEYNGTAWSEETNAPIARVKPFACGTLTAGLIGGGESGPSPASFQSSAEYDGTNWTASPSSAIGANAGDSTAFGIQTAAVLCMGSSSPTTAVKDYDGSTWTAGTATPIQMASSSGNGTDTAGLVYTGSAYSTSQSLAWNGSSWTSAGTLIAGRSRAAEAVGAPSTAALFFAGDNPSSTEHTDTYGYDGTAWSTRPNMATARRGLGGAGISTAAIAFAGYTGTADTAVSEEFTGETTALNIENFTTS